MESGYWKIPLLLANGGKSKISIDICEVTKSRSQRNSCNLLPKSSPRGYVFIAFQYLAALFHCKEG